jgi:hypothetical protein
MPDGVAAGCASHAGQSSPAAPACSPVPAGSAASRSPLPEPKPGPALPGVLAWGPKLGARLLPEGVNRPGTAAAGGLLPVRLSEWKEVCGTGSGSPCKLELLRGPLGIRGGGELPYKEAGREALASVGAAPFLLRGRVRLVRAPAKHQGDKGG